MLQCTAIRQLPGAETLALIYTADMTPDPEELQDHPVEFAAGYAVCELGEGHDGDHIDHISAATWAIGRCWQRSTSLRRPSTDNGALLWVIEAVSA